MTHLCVRVGGGVRSLLSSLLWGQNRYSISIRFGGDYKLRDPAFGTRKLERCSPGVHFPLARLLSYQHFPPNS